jgi:hypothetical protein
VVAVQRVIAARPNLVAAALLSGTLQKLVVISLTEAFHALEPGKCCLQIGQRFALRQTDIFNVTTALCRSGGGKKAKQNCCNNSHENSIHYQVSASGNCASLIQQAGSLNAKILLEICQTHVSLTAAPGACQYEGNP